MGLTIGGQIHLARKARGYSLQALADEVGVSKTAVIKWEEGSNSPSVENLIKLEKILDVRFYLSGGTSHANEEEGWRVSRAASPESVELAVLFSRLPKAQYEAICSLISMSAERSEEQGGGSVTDIPPAEDHPHEATPGAGDQPPEKPRRRKPS